MTLEANGPKADDRPPIILTIKLVHKPTDGNETFDGVLSVEHLTPEGIGDRMKRGMSLLYSRTTDDNGVLIKYNMRSGEFSSDNKTIFDSDGVLDLNVGANFDGATTDIDYGGYPEIANPNRSSRSLNYVDYEGYPALEVARLAYWVNFGGNYTESARGFVFNIEREDGVVKGCGIAGATDERLSIRKALNENLDLEPLGYFKPFACGNHVGASVWQQCFIRQDGEYVLDKSRHPPINADGTTLVPLTDDSIDAAAVRPPRPPPLLRR